MNTLDLSAEAATAAGGVDIPVLFPVHLEGLCSINGSDDLACTMQGLSMTRGAVLSRAAVAFGDEAILSLPHIGMQKGVVARHVDGGFEVQFIEASHVKLATYLAWLQGSTEKLHHENRRFERIVPIRKLATLDREGEPQSMIRIIDVSRSGVAFTTSKHLAIDEAVQVGLYPGRVVRLFDGGAAVEFDGLIDVDTFDVMIDLTAAA